MKEFIGEEWYNILKDEFDKDYMKDLAKFIQERRSKGLVYPHQKDVFNAYKYTPYSKCRVCIIGQDPYINAGEAHGLAFSTENGRYTPSLRKIEETISPKEWNNNLTRWTEQGIMLLNIVLTVDAGKSNSHINQGWEQFTARTVQELDKKGIIFLLWGKFAQTLSKYITNSTIIVAEHPVAASYQSRAWNNNDCFNKVNDLLEDKIKW